MPILSQLPPYIYGLHDIGGQDEMLNARRPGWILDTVDLRVQAGADYSSLSASGLAVVVRLNHGYEPEGTIPPSNQYESFAIRCAGYVENSPGAHMWIIGNEMNNSVERPRLPDHSREIITPENYARCFLKCRSAIKNIPGHSEDWVLPGAVAPYNAETGDWVAYFVAVLNMLGNRADGIVLHAYTHDYAVDQIGDDRMMGAPFQKRHFNFRTYRDFLQALPESFRTLPVLITEAFPLVGWRDLNVGWIQRAYAEIDAWNSDPSHQPIQGLILSRWQSPPTNPDKPADLRWSLQDKPAVLADFRAALKVGYRVRPPNPVPPASSAPPAWLGEPETGGASSVKAMAEPMPQPPPAHLPEPWAARFVAHDTPVCMSAGQSVSVSLQVKNVGTETWKQEGQHPVHAGYKWFNAAGEQQMDMDDRRTALPAAVLPEDKVVFGASLNAPQSPGNYTVRWDLVAEGITWFADVGNPPLVVPVAVTTHPVGVSNWRAESSLNPHEVAYALDGDPHTFWSSGVPQAPLQWFRLNLSAPRVIDGLQFISPGKGFPAGYSLHVSADGSSWTELVHVDGGNEHDVMAVFAPQLVQYVEIDLQTEAPGPWMLAEILIHPTSTWTASASHNNEQAGQAIDNQTDTVWSSGQPQEPGMWFQIDLGHEDVVSGLTLVSRSEQNPAGFRVSTWEPSGGQWQTVFEEAENDEPVDVMFTPTQTQFINIQLLKPADREWSICQAHLIREMDVWLGPTS